MKQSIVITSMVVLLILFSGLRSTHAQAPAKPYDENQDPRFELRKAVELALRENKHILVQFGGNWCPWCLKFHALVNGSPTIDSLMKANYVYLLLNVPKEKDKRDMDLFAGYGYPNRFGYPVFVILDKSGQRLNTQDSEPLEHPDPAIKGYDTTRVARFLTLWSPKALDPKSYQQQK
jgi:thioredoxin-related protein